MTDLEEGFDEALSAAAEANGGEAEFITFRGEPLEALIHEEQIAPDFVATGLSKSDPWKVDVRVREVQLPIKQSEPVVARGQALSVLSWRPLKGRISIWIGDISKEVQ